MDIINPLVDYLIKVLECTFNQIFILLAPIIILSFIMHYVSKGLSLFSHKLLGENGFIKFFGVVGVPIHELGHAFFAILFGHKITELKLFQLQSSDDTLGYVNHKYNKNNLYHTVGNFFIGIGPIIFGTTVLGIVGFLLFRLDLRASGFQEINFLMFSNSANFKVQITHLWEHLMEYTNIIVSNPNSWWKIIIFLYLLISIGGNITLSLSDIKSASKGFLVFTLILITFNIVTLWIGNFTIEIFAKASRYIALINFFIILSLFTNLIIILIMSMIYSIKLIIKRIVQILILT